MSAPIRTEQQRAIDRTEIAKLLRRGHTVGQIAEQLPHISYSQVRYDIKQFMAELAEERAEQAPSVLAAKLQEIAEIKREAWAEWEISKLPVTRYTKDGDAYEVREPQERYLRLIYDCVVKECELQGVRIPAMKEASEANPTEGLLEFMLPIVTEALKMLGAQATGPQIVTSVVQQLRDKAEANTGTAPPVEQDGEGSLEDYLNNPPEGS